MSDNSAIEWTDATWNPLLGCTKVSPGCDNCYAIVNARIRESNPNEKIATAYAGLVTRQAGHLEWTGQVNLLEERLDQPLRWQKPRRIFVNAQSDLFHESVPAEFIAKVFVRMSMARQHTFQILTKRHGRMRSLLRSPEFQVLAGKASFDLIQQEKRTVDWTWPLPNVWLGVSVEDQQWADIRIPALLDTPASVRWLSCEPLLGPVSLFANTRIDTGTLVDWVVVGGESGHQARAMHPAWARRLRDECDRYDVPFLFKQWGDGSLWVDKQGDVWTLGDDGLMHTPETAPFTREHVERKWGPLKPLSKRAAGRELDGRTWDEYPEAVS